jgi:hypothetical protein
VLLVDTGRPGWPVIWADTTWELWSGMLGDMHNAKPAGNAMWSAVVFSQMRWCSALFLLAGTSAHALCGQPLATTIQRSKDTIAPIQWELKQEYVFSQARFIVHSVIAQPSACRSTTNNRVMDLSFRPLALDLLDSDTLPVDIPGHVASVARKAHLQLYAVRVHAAGACSVPVQPLLPTMQVMFVTTHSEDAHACLLFRK